MATARKRRRKGNTVGPHKAKVHKGRRKCKKCGRNHSTSAHWSHAANSGKHSFHAKRHTGRRKARRKGRTFKRGGTTFGPVMKSAETPSYRKRKAARRRGLAQAHGAAYVARSRAAASVKPMTRKERSKLNKAAHRAKQHRVKPHLAKNAGRKPGSHRVAGHLAKNPTRRRKGGGRKKARSPAQKEATRRMLAARAAMMGRSAPARRHKGSGGRKKPRSKAQKAATKRMLAAAAAKRRGADIRPARRTRLG
jgi:hypothetical protein